ncbi:MAG: hypothetical protein WC792_00555 [Candidatus Micrarchaeia archaeon]|jgi:hypothetical protein
MLDLMAGVVVFLFAIASATALWENLLLQVHSAETRRELEFGVSSSSDLLLLTVGNPSNWTSGNASAIKSLGIADFSNGTSLPETGVVNGTKAMMLVELLESDYDDAKMILGAGAFGFGFSITNKSRELVNLSCAPSCWCGAQCWKTLNYSAMPASGVSDASAMRRAAVLHYTDASGNERKQIVNVNVFWWTQQ